MTMYLQECKLCKHLHFVWVPPHKHTHNHSGLPSHIWSLVSLFFLFSKFSPLPSAPSKLLSVFLVFKNENISKITRKMNKQKKKEKTQQNKNSLKNKKPNGKNKKKTSIFFFFMNKNINNTKIKSIWRTFVVGLAFKWEKKAKKKIILNLLIQS
jgi:hypothetical protein